ncbi:pyruvate kinase [Singulisphaera sp. PoT]|uniref:pyruvate kinase n=1 Tax=Singulisphaera sp. PoT TaxID=3411797 RepID=UPI003BF57391
MAYSDQEPLGKVRTKIVATIGPASREETSLHKLIQAGVDVFRLNFSHGNHADHSEVLARIRSLSREIGKPIAVLQDLGGPKIRLGAIAGDEVECREGETFVLGDEGSPTDPHRLTSTYPGLVEDLKVGDRVLFADGVVAMVVESIDQQGAHLRVTQEGRLRSRQGINVPGAALSVSALTDKDLQDLDWTADHPVEYVGLSFVRRPEDVLALRKELEKRGSRARIVSKIEKPQAVDQLDAIIEQSDAVMVARGDLGVEMDVARVPAIQKRIIAACNRARVPVITATQMLNSMETSSRPTRAEASDVFNAVLDGTDAVMLSGETAIGHYPVEAVATMSRIVREAEALLFGPGGSSWSAIDPRAAATARAKAGMVQPITESVVEAASLACRRLEARLLVVATHSGRTALALSKQRHATPTLALTDDVEITRAMSLFWGVTPLFSPDIKGAEHALTTTLEWARPRGLVTKGDLVVLISGTMPNSPIHNAMLVREIE